MKNKFYIAAGACALLSLPFFTFLKMYSFSGFALLAFCAFFLLMGITKGFKSRRVMIFRRIASILVVIGLIFLAILFCFVTSEASGDEEEPCDYVIVLGAGLLRDTPSRTLVDRLERTLVYLNNNPASVAIVTGGQGKRETITEALAMERWLISHSVEPSRIIKEDKAENTNENFENSLEIIESRGGGSCAVVSSDYHIYRSRRLAESKGINPVMLAAKSTAPYLYFNSALRETVALIKAYLLFI